MPKLQTKSRPASAAAASESYPSRKNAETVRRNLAGNDGDSISPGGENLDKVRDILFGSQIRDSERRFASLEERFTSQTTQIADELRKRLDALDALIRKETQAAQDKLRVEQTQRAEALKGLSGDIKESAKTIAARIAEVIEQNTVAQRLLRQELAEQAKALREEARTTRSEAAAETQRVIGELRAQKVDRKTLAAVLADLAGKLADLE